MVSILSKIPFYVWPLTVLALFGGWRARRTAYTPLNVILLIPTIFLIWALNSFFNKYGSDLRMLSFWAVHFAVGIVIGLRIAKSLHPKFHLERRLVELPGSYMPLLLSSFVIGSKFTIGITGGIYPSLQGSVYFFMLELLSAIVLGVISGRAVGLFRRYSLHKAQHANE